MFRQDKENVFAVKVVKPWKRLPTKVFDAPPYLSVLMGCLGNALNNVL